MSHRTRRRLLALAPATALAVIAVPAIATSTSTDNTAAARHAVVGGQARSVILLIGDGMGDSEITIARNYQVGAAGRLSMDRLPLTGAYTTYAVTEGNPKLPDYVTDSAASGTGWATGTKTYNGAISVNAYGKPRPSVLEQAKAAGFRTGNVTSAELQDATPAVLGAHVVSRDCKGPDAMAQCPQNDIVNGGAGSIAEQLVQTHADVMLGGGSRYFDQTVKAGRFAGLTVAQQAQVGGYQVVRTAEASARASSCRSREPRSTSRTTRPTPAARSVPGSQQHTGTEVRIAAGGPQAANVLGVTDQTELNTTMRRALGLL